MATSMAFFKITCFLFLFTFIHVSGFKKIMQNEQLIFKNSKNINSGVDNYLIRRKATADWNLQNFLSNKRLTDAPYASFIPGTKAFSFTLPTLNGNFNYDANASDIGPIILAVYNPLSGFLQCLWNCSDSIEDLVKFSPSNTRYIFIPSGKDAYFEAVRMKDHFKNAVRNVYRSLEKADFREKHRILKLSSQQLHFVTVSLDEVGNAIPEVLNQWMCLDHNCGLSQILFQSDKISTEIKHPLVTSRLDSRYDWLPSPESVLKGTHSAVFVKDSCSSSSLVKGKLAVVVHGNCSYFTMVKAMEHSGAIGVVVMSENGVQDMNCEGSECKHPLSIPATSIPYLEILTQPQNLSVKFQTTPSDNFFMAIDHQGNLAEVGWFLYPTMHFLAWQAQWFNYKAELNRNITKQAYVINLFNKTVMHGSPGAQIMLSLPSVSELMKYNTIELDTSLSCPGTLDRDCPHWDHTVTLRVCCNKMCNLELGRWITSFRRRIGRWLTDITHLLPLFDGLMCTFTMSTSAWAMPWLPSLNLRLTGQRQKGELYPYKLIPLYNGDSFIFDKKYNSHFKPVTFNIPSGVVKVSVSAVITGHGSDENGCGEFCNTSHHFVINTQHKYSIYFNISGTPLGCADKVPQGVTPNEHGTWLYGRDGWCDGQDVKPWLFDVTSDLNMKGNNTLIYYGYFNGTDPNPKQNPGVMIISSYIVMYKTV